MTDNKLIERLQERAEGYRQSGPSAEHTATLLSEAAAALTAALAVEQDMSTAEPVSVTVKEAMEVAKEINDFIGGELRQTFWWEQKAKLMAQALSALSHVQTPAPVAAPSRDDVVLECIAVIDDMPCVGPCHAHYDAMAVALRALISEEPS